jgi:uncharacterized membrane protein
MDRLDDRRFTAGMGFRGAALLAATLTTGLAAGLFYAFAYAVMPGLAGTDDRTYVGSMQRINVAILNGWFALAFGGALVFTAVAAALHVRADGRSILPWVLAALVLYLATIAVTMGINVPLNDTLAAAGEPARIADLTAVREHFEAKWVRWNIVRTITCTAAFGCLTWALVLHGRAGTPG